MRHATLTSICVGFLALLAVHSAARAQSTAAMRQVCAEDYAAHCTGSDPAPGLERGCLGQYYINLSRPCRAALDAARADGAGQGVPNATAQ